MDFALIKNIMYAGIFVDEFPTASMSGPYLWSWYPFYDTPIYTDFYGLQTFILAYYI